MQSRLYQKTLILFLCILLQTPNVLILTTQVRAYTPVIGHQTNYDYGFIYRQSNLTAPEIQFWTMLSLAPSNYSIIWNQHVNLTIAVIPDFYNRTVSVHSNTVFIENSSWHTTISLNGSTSAPAPTGIASGLISPSIGGSLEGFFLDDAALNQIAIGTNVTLGGGLWNSISQSHFQFYGVNHTCYELINVSTTANEETVTKYLIDQYVGIYYFANESRRITVGSLEQRIQYYFVILATNIPLSPTPNLLPLLVIIVVVSLVVIIAIILVIRRIRRRHH